MSDLSRREILPILLGTGIAVPLVPKLISAKAEDLRKLAQPGKLIENTPKEWNIEMWPRGFSYFHGFYVEDGESLSGIAVDKPYNFFSQDQELICTAKITGAFLWYDHLIPINERPTAFFIPDTAESYELLRNHIGRGKFNKITVKEISS